MNIKIIVIVTTLLLASSFIFGQNQLSQSIVDAYQEEGWLYVSGRTFIYGEKEKGYGNPKVLALSIDQSSSTAILLLYEYDCNNKRMMSLAYKKYQNKPIMEREHYLFDHLKKWDYPLKTSVGDLMMQLVCSKYGNIDKTNPSRNISNSGTKNYKSTYDSSPILEKPEMSGKIIGKVENEKVEIIQKVNSNFYKVRSENTIGYLWKGWIK